MRKIVVLLTIIGIGFSYETRPAVDALKQRIQEYVNGLILKVKKTAVQQLTDVLQFEGDVVSAEKRIMQERQAKDLRSFFAFLDSLGKELLAKTTYGINTSTTYQPQKVHSFKAVMPKEGVTLGENGPLVLSEPVVQSNELDKVPTQLQLSWWQRAQGAVSSAKDTAQGLLTKATGKVKATIDTVVKSTIEPVIEENRTKKIERFLGIDDQDNEVENSGSPELLAYERLLFEITWNIPSLMCLSSEDDSKIIKMIMETDYPHYKSRSTALKELAKVWSEKYGSKFNNPFVLNKNILSEIPLSWNLYDSETLTENFNKHTSQQLLYWVQKQINTLFSLKEVHVGIKYRLLHWIKKTQDDDKSLKDLYWLAFMQGSKDSKQQKLALQLLHTITTTTDWIYGRATVFWEAKWRKEGQIPRALKLHEALALYESFSKSESDILEAQKEVSVFKPDKPTSPQSKSIDNEALAKLITLVKRQGLSKLPPTQEL